MSVAYKGPTGWLYRVSEQPDAKGEYYIEYRDPAASAVYKPLPGYHHNANRDAVVSQLAGLIKELGLQAVMLEEPPTNPAPTPEKPKGSGVWLYGDHRAMRVGIGNDTDRSDCRYYHVLVLNLLADKPCWRKLSGAGNYDYKHLADADAELREALPEDTHELTATEAKQLFTSPSTGFFELKPNAVKAWDEIMAGPSSTAKPASDAEPIPEWAIPIAREFVGIDWVRKLEYFSAACLRASPKAQSYAGGTCGPGFADTSPKGIKLWEDAPGHGIEYTWGKFVRACKVAGIAPKAPAPATGPASAPADVCATCLCNTCGNDGCDNAPGCRKDKDCCAETGNTVKCDDYQPKSSPEPATAEPQEVNVVQPATEPAALTAPPAADIAAPGFDFSALGDLAEQAAEDDREFDFHAARVREEYGFACVYLARVHDLTARAGRYGGGTWTKWCEAKGLSEGTAKRMLEIGDGFKSAKLADLKNLAVFGKGELRAIATSGSEEVKETATTGDTERVKELLAQLKATEQAKTEVERKVQGLKTSYNTAHANEEYNIGLRKKATEEAEKAKAQAAEAQRRAEQAERKAQEQDEMLAELQDRLDEANVQLRNPPLEATMVDKDEVERRAQELAAQKIAEVTAQAAGRVPSLCELAAALNDTIKSAWELSGLEDREPESEEDAAALEALDDTLFQIADWITEYIGPEERREAAEDE